MTSAASSGIRHEALLYRDDDELVRLGAAYLREGLAADETVVVAETAHRLALLREELADDAAAVRWVDVVEVAGNPGRIIPLWADLVAEQQATGRPVRGLGEAAFTGRRPAELAEVEITEALLDHAFAAGPSWRLMCAYDRAVPASVLAGVMRTHRTWRDAEGDGTSAGYRPVTESLDLAVLGADAPLPPPSDVVLRGEFGLRDVPAVRRTVRVYARSCGLPVEQVENLELAASELASNCIRHGGGSGALAMWREPDAVVVEFSCPGRLTDPLAGRRRPDPLAGGGMGLYLVQQLCDLVQIRTGPAGTTVRVTTWAGC